MAAQQTISMEELRAAKEQLGAFLVAAASPCCCPVRAVVWIDSPPPSLFVFCLVGVCQPALI